MAVNFIPNQIQTFVNDTTAVNNVNNNFTAVQTGFTDVLSRSGVSPNQMQSALDMNSNQIINLPFPTTANSPARLADIAGGQITVNTATTGTSGHVVPFLDGTNTWSAPQTITLGSLGTGTGLTLNETVSGTNAAGVAINVIAISDALNVSPANSTGLFINQVFGGSTSQGGRNAILADVSLTSATNAASANRNYVAIVGNAFANSADNGTNPATSGTSAGGFFGGNFSANASNGATALLNTSGAEFNIAMAAGSSTWSKSLAQFSSGSTDAVNGTGINTMLWLYNQTGSTAKWTNAILVDNAGGLGTFPLATTATIFKTGTGTVTNGIDLSGTTFSGNAYASSGYSVNGVGKITSGAAGVASGALSLVGLTSGSAGIFVNNTGNQVTIDQPVVIGQSGLVGGSLFMQGSVSGSVNIFASAVNSVLSTSNSFAASGTLTSGSVGGSSGSLTLFGSTSGSVIIQTPAASAGLVQFASSGSFSANGAVATSLGSIGPTGSHTTVQKWLTIVDNTGTTLYIPAF